MVGNGSLQTGELAKILAMINRGANLVSGMRLASMPVQDSLERREIRSLILMIAICDTRYSIGCI